MAEDHLVLLSVHAHPDDESSKGAATVARYVDEGVEAVLVCCTGGEEGEILNPAMDTPEVHAQMPGLRMQELDKATAAIGYHHVELLGYRDSGMPGSEANARPEAFTNAPADEAVGKLVGLMRKYRPDVVLTYGDDQEFYPHPDHLRVHDISIAAFAASSDPNAFPDAGEPWEPKKLYYSTFSFARFQEMVTTFKEAGVALPFPDDDEMMEKFSDNDHRITTVVNVAKYADARKQALLAHATQIDPEMPWWFGLSDEHHDEMNSEEDYILAESRVDTKLPEDDLFAGLR